MHDAKLETQIPRPSRRGQVRVVMVLAWMCFGCKGAHAIGHVAHVAHVGSGALHVAGAAPRVVVGGVVARDVGAIARAGSHVGASSDGSSAEAEGPESRPACVELPPAPEHDGDLVWVRRASCRSHLIVQDPQTGLWRAAR